MLLTIKTIIAIVARIEIIAIEYCVFSFFIIYFKITQIIATIETKINKIKHIHVICEM